MNDFQSSDLRCHGSQNTALSNLKRPRALFFTRCCEHRVLGVHGGNACVERDDPELSGLPGPADPGQLQRWQSCAGRAGAPRGQELASPSHISAEVLPGFPPFSGESK